LDLLSLYTLDSVEHDDDQHFFKGNECFYHQHHNVAREGLDEYKSKHKKSLDQEVCHYVPCRVLNYIEKGVAQLISLNNYRMKYWRHNRVRDNRQDNMTFKYDLDSFYDSRKLASDEECKIDYPRQFIRLYVQRRIICDAYSYRKTRFCLLLEERLTYCMNETLKVSQRCRMISERLSSETINSSIVEIIDIAESTNSKFGSYLMESSDDYISDLIAKFMSSNNDQILNILRDSKVSAHDILIFHDKLDEIKKQTLNKIPVDKSTYNNCVRIYRVIFNWNKSLRS